MEGLDIVFDIAHANAMTLMVIDEDKLQATRERGRCVYCGRRQIVSEKRKSNRKEERIRLVCPCARVPNLGLSCDVSLIDFHHVFLVESKLPLFTRFHQFQHWSARVPVCRVPVCPCARVPVCPCARVPVARVPVCPCARVPVCPCARAPVRPCARAPVRPSARTHARTHVCIYRHVCILFCE